MKKIKGIIESFNVSPKGYYEGFLLKSGDTTMQVNFPHKAGPEYAQGLEVGGKVALQVEKIDDDRPSDHPVFEWTREDDEPRSGVVKQINFARHGEANGAILESGEFLHLRPDGAKAAKLSVGAKVTFEGESARSSVGFTVIEASVVNGIDLPRHKDKAKAKKKHA